MTSITSAPLTPNPAQQYIAEAKDTLCQALLARGATELCGRVHRTSDGFAVRDIVARKAHTEDIIDIAATEPITSGHGTHHQAYDTLAAFAADYLARVLAVEPEPFLTEGQILLLAKCDRIAQPIDHDARSLHAEAEQKAKLLHSKQPLIEALAHVGATQVVITYDGEGDSGQINDIAATNPNGDAISLDVPHPLPYAQTSTLRDALDDFARDCLEAYHAGFEDNEGGQGEITIDVASGLVIIDHNDRIIELSNTTMEL